MSYVYICIRIFLLGTVCDQSRRETHTSAYSTPPPPRAQHMAPLGCPPTGEGPGGGTRSARAKPPYSACPPKRQKTPGPVDRGEPWAGTAWVGLDQSKKVRKRDRGTESYRRNLEGQRARSAEQREQRGTPMATWNRKRTEIRKSGNGA